MSPTTVLSVVIITLFLINLARKWKSWMHDPVSQFGGPFRLPIVGHLYKPARWSPKKVFNELISDWFIKYPSPSTMYLILRSPIVIVYDPENVQILVNKALDKSSDYSKFTRYYGNGIVTDNNHERRKNRRKLVLPSISLKMMGSYFVNEYSRLNEYFAKELEVHADTGTEIDLWPSVQRTNCSIFAATFLKLDENDWKDIEVSKFGRAIPGVLEHMKNRIFFPWMYSEVGSSLSAWISGKKQFLRDFDYSSRKIREKLEARINTEAYDSIEEGEETKKTFAEILYSLRGSELYTPDLVIEEIMSFFMGTTDLRAIAVSFTLLMLAMHENSQEKVFEEISSVLNYGEDTITMEDFNQLTYLDQCIKETLRLFPSLPWIARRTTKEVTLKDGRILPSGCNVILAIIGLHRDPAVYENPTMWMPERFLPDQIAKRHPYSFIPFSIGGRKCLGYDNAFLSIKIQIVSVIKRYKLTTDMKLSDIELNFDLHLRNEAGFRMYLQKRNSS